MSTYVLWSTFFALVNDVPYAFALAKLLNMKHPWVFFLTRLAIVVPFLLVRYDVDLAVRTAFGVTHAIIWPMLFSRDPLGRRLLFVTVAVVCQGASEAVANMAWFMATGIGTFAAGEDVMANFPAYVLVNAVFLACESLLLLTFYLLAARFTPDREAVETPLYVAFPFAQLVLVMMIIAYGMAIANAGALFLPVALLIFLCLAADVVLFVKIDRFRSGQRERERARAANERLERSRQQAEQTIARIEQTARFRHDVRNQLQTALILAERGERERAREHVAALRAQLEEGPRR